MSSHLLNEYERALQILEEFRKTQQVSESKYIYIFFYQSSLF